MNDIWKNLPFATAFVIGRELDKMLIKYAKEQLKIKELIFAFDNLVNRYK